MRKRRPVDVVERSCLLNALQYYPTRRKDEVIRWCKTRWASHVDDVLTAAKKLCLIETEKDGEIYWTRPANVVALWWWRKDDSDVYCQSGGGNAA